MKDLQLYIYEVLESIHKEVGQDGYGADADVDSEAVVQELKTLIHSIKNWES